MCVVTNALSVCVLSRCRTAPWLQETKRLSKMAEDKAVAATKRETFQWRLNVLASFSKAAPGEGGKAEL
jgi:hypothetical protein